MAFIAIGTVIGTVVRQNTTTDPSPDVSIVPIPSWSNITNNQTNSTYTVAVQRIQGINTTITLQVDKTAGTMNVYRRVDTTAPTWTNGGSWDGNTTGWTLMSSYPHTFTVTNNQYVSFACVTNGVSATSSITVTNVSDTNLPLDTITATTTYVAPDVTINPTPNWANITATQVGPAYTAAVQQIQGINTTVTLEVTKTAGTMALYRRVDNSIPTWTNGGSWNGDKTGWTLISSYPHTFTVTNNQYVSYACEVDGVTASSTVTIKNVSDSNVTLDTFTANTTASAQDNTPTPTPNWANISLNTSSGEYVAAVQQITGISTNINLQIEKNPLYADCIIYYKRSSTAPPFVNGGQWDGDPTGWTQILSSYTTVNMPNNEYLMFGCEIDVFNEATVEINIRNLSDGNVLLDTFFADITPF